MPQLTVLILTHNEQKNLPACLESLRPLTAHVQVVDSGSTDATLRISESFGATVISHPFENHSKQWNWALQNTPVETEWILGIDADQRVSPELKQSIEVLLHNHPKENGAYVARRQIFLGRWIRHGGYYPKYLLKLFRREFVEADENDLVDHHFRVRGPIAILQGDLIEDNQKERDLSFWMQKHVRYASLQALQEQQSAGFRFWRGRFFGQPDERVQWLKSLWERLPLFVRPFVYFGYRYFLQLGFLDGVEGLIFHGFQGFWYRFLIDIRLSELKQKAQQ